jgi:hypothetical protein
MVIGGARKKVILMLDLRGQIIGRFLRPVR